MWTQLRSIEPCMSFRRKVMSALAVPARSRPKGMGKATTASAGGNPPLLFDYRGKKERAASAGPGKSGARFNDRRTSARPPTQHFSTPEGGEAGTSSWSLSSFCLFPHVSSGPRSVPAYASPIGPWDPISFWLRGRPRSVVVEGHGGQSLTSVVCARPAFGPAGAQPPGGGCSLP